MEHPTTPGTPHLRIVRRAPSGLSPHSGRHCLGVLGGAYNPITLAHVAMAEATVQAFQLHEVLFVLPQVPPHKTIFGATLEQRLSMMQLALADCPFASVGLSTHGLFLDMYRSLLPMYTRQTDVFFLTGRDAAERILSWNYEDAAAALAQMFTAFQLIVCDREGTFRLPDDPLLAPYAHRIHRCALPPDYNAISSTEVRQRCQHGRSLEGLVTPAVARYIQQQQLYRDPESSAL